MHCIFITHLVNQRLSRTDCVEVVRFLFLLIVGLEPTRVAPADFTYHYSFHYQTFTQVTLRFPALRQEAFSSTIASRESDSLFVCGLDYAFTIFMFYHDGCGHPFFINLGR